jgi:hypothetical protein
MLGVADFAHGSRFLRVALDFDLARVRAAPRGATAAGYCFEIVIAQGLDLKVVKKDQLVILLGIVHGGLRCGDALLQCARRLREMGLINHA